MAVTQWVLQPIKADKSIEEYEHTVAQFRYVGSSAPVTTGWNTNDLWLDTSTENTALIVRRWNGTAFKP